MDIILKLIIAVSLMFMGLLFSSLRYWILMRGFIPGISLKEAHRINIKSVIASQIFFNFFGQVFAREALTRKSTGLQSTSVIVTSVERMCGVSVLVIGLVLLTLWVTGNVDGMSQNILIISLYIPFISVVLLLVFFFKLRGRARRLIIKFASRPLLKTLLISLAITLVVHTLTLFCYLILVSESYNILPKGETFLASLFTMAASSLPFVPGGWGAREVSAAFSFSQAGFDVFRGAAVGLGVGIASVVALVIHAFWVGIDQFTTKAKATVSEEAADRMQPYAGVSHETLFSLATLSWLAPFVVGILTFFQFQLYSIDSTSPTITLNVADPLAIAVGLSVLFFAHKNLLRPDNWRFHGFFLSLLVMGISILIAFSIGYWRYGLIEWALLNRLVGFGVILSFFVSGAFLVQKNGSWTIHKMLDILLFIAALAVLLEFLARFVIASNFIIFFDWQYRQNTGFLQNRNAWAFFLLIVAFSWIGVTRKVAFNPFIGLVLVGICLTFSRSGVAVLAICFVFLFFFDFRKFKYFILSFIFIFTIYYILFLIFNYILNLTENNYNFIKFSIDNDYRTDGKFTETRMVGYAHAWRLFIENPLWGAGLGSHVQTFIRDQIYSLNIHNTFLWVLAEFGILGFFLFFSPFITVIIQFFRQNMNFKIPNVQALFFCFLVFGGFSIFHEMAYQRIFWFVLGMLTASAGAFRNIGRAPSAPRKKTSQ